MSSKWHSVTLTRRKKETLSMLMSETKNETEWISAAGLEFRSFIQSTCGCVIRSVLIQNTWKETATSHGFESHRTVQTGGQFTCLLFARKEHELLTLNVWAICMMKMILNNSFTILALVSPGTSIDASWCRCIMSCTLCHSAISRFYYHVYVHCWW